MTSGDDRSSVEESRPALEDEPLSPLLTIQESPTTRGAVAALRKWARSESEFDHCVITGPRGSGRTHLLEALAGALPRDQTMILPAHDRDWSAALRSVASSGSSWVLIDDLDQYDGSFLKQFLAIAAERKHRVAASMNNLAGRPLRLWNTHLSKPCDVRLASLAERVEDIAAFLSTWAVNAGRMLPDGIGFADTARLITAMQLPRGFSDLTRLLNDLAALSVAIWDPPDAITWVSVYTRTVLGPRTTRPAILVEGRSDSIYLDWVSDLAIGSPPEDLVIEVCQSASRIPEKSFACRNESRASVGLFDFDFLGKKLNEQMKQYDLLSLVIPNRFDPLAGRALDHVQQVVEIEDLLPTSEIERFMEETGHVPELIIDSPRLHAKRIVVHSDDKLELASWVRSTLGSDSAERLLDLYNALRQKLSLPTVAFEVPLQPTENRIRK